MSIEREYEIVLQSESEGGFSVFVPELPRVATQGETIEEATEMAKEAIEAYLEVMHEDRLPIPAVHRVGVAVHAARAPSSRRSTASRSSLPSKYVSEVWGSHHVR